MINISALNLKHCPLTLLILKLPQVIKQWLISRKSLLFSYIVIDKKQASTKTGKIFPRKTNYSNMKLLESPKSYLENKIIWSIKKNS